MRSPADAVGIAAGAVGGVALLVAFRLAVRAQMERRRSLSGPVALLWINGAVCMVLAVSLTREASEVTVFAVLMLVYSVLMALLSRLAAWLLWPQRGALALSAIAALALLVGLLSVVGLPAITFPVWAVVAWAMMERHQRRPSI